MYCIFGSYGCKIHESAVSVHEYACLIHERPQHAVSGLKVYLAKHRLRVCLDFGFRGKNELFFDEVALKNGRIVGLRNYFLKQKSSEKSCFSPEAKVQTYA